MDHVLSTHLFVKHRLTTVWLERIWNAGIPAVEIFCARQHFDYQDRPQVRELGHWFRDSELKLFSIHSPMYNDDCWGRTGPNSVITLTEVSKPRRQQMVDEIKCALDVSEVVPCRYLVQHLGVTGEEYDDRKLDAAFTALEELSVFARQRGVEILLENTPNRLSTAERLLYFLKITHLKLNFCFDVGHAHLSEGVEAAYSLMKSRIRSTHIHDNDGESDGHLLPLMASGGAVDWKTAMALLRSRPDQYPLLLELKESPDFPHPIDAAAECLRKLEEC